MKQTQRLTLILAACAAGMTARLVAQAAATPRAGDEVVRLTEFNVTASEDRGYAPAETMTGSRVATKIIDLPYTVNVLTSEFFEDFAIFELADKIGRAHV